MHEPRTLKLNSRATKCGTDSNQTDIAAPARQSLCYFVPVAASLAMFFTIARLAILKQAQPASLFVRSQFTRTSKRTCNNRDGFFSSDAVQTSDRTKEELLREKYLMKLKNRW